MQRKRVRSNRTGRVKKKNSQRTQQFLRAHMAMERPTVQHLYFSKGIVDFLLGLVVGIGIGLALSLL